MVFFFFGGGSVSSAVLHTLPCKSTRRELFEQGRKIAKQAQWHFHFGIKFICCKLLTRVTGVEAIYMQPVMGRRSGLQARNLAVLQCTVYARIVFYFVFTNSCPLWWWAAHKIFCQVFFFFFCVLPVRDGNFLLTELLFWVIPQSFDDPFCWWLVYFSCHNYVLSARSCMIQVDNHWYKEMKHNIL